MRHLGPQPCLPSRSKRTHYSPGCSGWKPRHHPGLLPSLSPNPSARALPALPPTASTRRVPATAPAAGPASTASCAPNVQLLPGTCMALPGPQLLPLCVWGVLWSPPPCKCHEQGPRGLLPAVSPTLGASPEAVSTALATAPSVRESSKGQARTGPGGLTQTGTWAPHGAKEDGGSSSGLGCAVGGGFRPEAHGRGLLGSSADRVGPTGWTWCRPHSHRAWDLRGEREEPVRPCPQRSGKEGARPQGPRTAAPTPACWGCCTPGAPSSARALPGSLGVAAASVPNGQHCWEETGCLPRLPRAWDFVGAVIQPDP